MNVSHSWHFDLLTQAVDRMPKVRRRSTFYGSGEMQTLSL